MAPTAPTREPEMQDTPPCRCSQIQKIPEALVFKASGIGPSDLTVFFEKVPIFKGLRAATQRYLRKKLLVQAVFSGDVFKFRIVFVDG